MYYSDDSQEEHDQGQRQLGYKSQQSQNEEDEDEDEENKRWDRGPINLADRLDNKQRIYLKELSEKANIKFYKQEFLDPTSINNKFPFVIPTLTMMVQELKKRFEPYTNIFQLCGVQIRIHLKGHLNKLIKMQQKKIQMESIPQKLIKMLNLCIGSQTQIVAAPNALQQVWRLEHVRSLSYLHITLKIEKEREVYIKNTISHLGLKNPKYPNVQHLSIYNCSQLLNLPRWSLFCDTRDSYYEYFNVDSPEHLTSWISFSRSLNSKDMSIREIILFTRFQDRIMLRVKIKKEQISQIKHCQEAGEYYIRMSYPPAYEICTIKQNTYMLPNYLKQWERVQNFIFLKHPLISQNDILRMYLFSNTSLRLQIAQSQLSSRRHIITELSIIEKELDAKKNKVDRPYKFKSGLEDINQQTRQTNFFPYLRSHWNEEKQVASSLQNWRFLYQFQLLIRYNFLPIEQIQDFSKFLQMNVEKSPFLLKLLSQWSINYSKKTAMRNKHKPTAYMQLKRRLFSALRQEILQLGFHSAAKTADFCYIYKINLTPSGYILNPASPQSKCRLIREYQNEHEFFMKITLCDQNQEQLKNKKHLNQKIMKHLIHDVKIFGEQLVPLGWSGSQLKNYSIWFFRQILQAEPPFKKMTQQSILEFLGDFDDIKIAAKKAARIGQSFSSSDTFDSSNIIELIRPDVKSISGHQFTDGIGKISPDLLKAVANQIGLKMQTLCCLQIRYKGAKGVVLLNEEIDPNTVVLRKSMIKYECRHPNAKKYFDVLDYNKYKPGYLNRQIIVLLKSLKISDEVFIRFQDEYIKRIQDLNYTKEDNIIRVLDNADVQGKQKFNLSVNILRNCNVNLEEEYFFQELLYSVKYNRLLQLKRKTHILVEKSARLIGVIDDYGILRENQVYCSISPENILSQKTTIKGDVIVTRNPSLSPADVRKRRCVSQQEVRLRFLLKDKPNYFSSFVNCVVFPMEGEIPLTAQISGSDLDGDTFFICWDPQFIFYRQLPPECIDEPDKKIKSSVKILQNVTYSDILDFFIEYANCESLGVIANTHLIQADLDLINYADNPKCKLLAKLHGKAVDYAKSGEMPQMPRECRVFQYPHFMEKWFSVDYKSESILGKLYDRSALSINKFQKQPPKVRNGRIKASLLRNFKWNRYSHLLEDVVRQLCDYQGNLRNLIELTESYDEYELFSGYSSKMMEKQNSFGKERFSNLLLAHRKKHLERFFASDAQGLKKYNALHHKDLDKSENGGYVFSQLVVNRAIMFYLVSYACYFKKDVIIQEGILRRDIIEEIVKVKRLYYYEGNFLSFVWFIIPKIILNVQYINSQR